MMGAVVCLSIGKVDMKNSFQSFNVVQCGQDLYSSVYIDFSVSVMFHWIKQTASPSIQFYP